MKLYTEEQLLNTAEAIRDYLKNYPEKFKQLIKNLNLELILLMQAQYSTTYYFF